MEVLLNVPGPSFSGATRLMTEGLGDDFVCQSGSANYIPMSDNDVGYAGTTHDLCVHGKTVDVNMALLSVLRDKVLATGPLLQSMLLPGVIPDYNLIISDLLRDYSVMLGRFRALTVEDLTFRWPVIPESVVVGPYCHDIEDYSVSDLPLFVVQHVTRHSVSVQDEQNAKRLGVWFNKLREAVRSKVKRPLLPGELLDFVRPRVARWLATGCFDKRLKRHFPRGIDCYCPILSATEYGWERMWFNGHEDQHLCKSALVRQTMWDQPGWVSLVSAQVLRKDPGEMVTTEEVEEIRVQEKGLRESLRLIYAPLSEGETDTLCDPRVGKLKVPVVAFSADISPRTASVLAEAIRGSESLEESQALLEALANRAPFVPLSPVSPRPKRSAAAVASLAIANTSAGIGSSNAALLPIYPVNSPKKRRGSGNRYVPFILKKRRPEEAGVSIRAVANEEPSSPAAIEGSSTDRILCTPPSFPLPANEECSALAAGSGLGWASAPPTRSPVSGMGESLGVVGSALTVLQQEVERVARALMTPKLISSEHEGVVAASAAADMSPIKPEGEEEVMGGVLEKMIAEAPADFDEEELVNMVMAMEEGDDKSSLSPLEAKPEV
jgi:hypothetical protein